MRGGKREGAGRKPGSISKLTKAEGATIAELARAYTEISIERLGHIAVHGTTESAVIAACNSLLDRGHGKPAQFSTSDDAAFKRALDLTDDQLADIASRGSVSPAPEAKGPKITH